MSWAKLKVTLGLLVAAGGATLIFVQTTRVTDLRRDNAELAARLETSKQATGQAQQALRKLQAAMENNPIKVELARLRGEVTRLRQRQGELESAEQQLQQTGRSASAPAPVEPAPEDEEEAARQMGIAKMNYAKRWGLALLTYASENNGRLPETHETAAAYLEEDPQDGQPLPGGFDPPDPQPEQYELLYSDLNLNDLESPGTTILMREREPWVSYSQSGWCRAYLFADGHSEIHFDQDGDFAAWERDRLVSPGE